MQSSLRGSTVPCLGIAILIVAAGVAAQTPPEANRMEATHAPTPFSAAEIRQDCASGAWRTFRLQSQGPEGWVHVQQTMRFLDSGPEQTEIEVVEVKGSGAPGEPQRQTATWRDLQAHASFPESNTRIELVPVEIDAGRFDAWLYSVVTNGGKDEKRFWFARELAGPPVHMEHWSDGKLVFKMTLLDHGRGGYSAD